jgi:hypothetical protein
MPDAVGGEETEGGTGWTTVVGEAVADTVPPAFDAVTRTASVSPTSALARV